MIFGKATDPAHTVAPGRILNDRPIERGEQYAKNMPKDINVTAAVVVDTWPHIPIAAAAP
ncbi:hypothetical protein SCACP_08770 [Sporomusa carbonis]|uniref:hypothetical protein n=1 Tax=Sporomusa carbonis TaxID=3076075 RepID=UPI003A67BA72